MQYILGEDVKEDGCIFCRYPGLPEAERRERLVLRVEPEAFVLLNRYPYTNGHLLVVPRVHVPQLTALDDEPLIALTRLLRFSLAQLEGLLRPDGFNIGINQGRVAGAGIDSHLHYHIVPRWNGDHSFLPVLGEIRLINEHLEATWAKLRPGFAEGEP
jgi:ATP adenylyltransferase